VKRDDSLPLHFKIYLSGLRNQGQQGKEEILQNLDRRRGLNWCTG